MKTFLDFSP